MIPIPPSARGYCYARLGMYDLAIQDYDRVLALGIAFALVCGCAHTHMYAVRQSLWCSFSNFSRDGKREFPQNLEFFVYFD